jgi:predicted O-methyltransferase YrrM
VHPRLRAAEDFAREAERVRRRSLELGIPSIEPEDGLVLYTAALAAAAGRRRCLAVDAGAGIGYSTLWIAKGLRDAGCTEPEIVMAEWEPELAAHAEETIRASPLLRGAARVHQGDALRLLQQLPDDTATLVFVDVEKNLYPATVREAERILHPGGAALWHNAFYPSPPPAFYTVLDASKLAWGVAPTSAGIVVAYKPAGAPTRARA